MQLRVITPVRGHRGVQVLTIPVFDIKHADQEAKNLTQDRMSVVDLIDHNGKFIKNYQGAK